MHTLALLAAVVAQVSHPPGTLTIGEGVGLAIITAVATLAAAWGLLRGQVGELRERGRELADRLSKVEATTTPTTLAIARVEVRLDHMERGINSGFESIRRELTASGALPRHGDRGDDR